PGGPGAWGGHGGGVCRGEPAGESVARGATARLAGGADTLTDGPRGPGDTTEGPPISPAEPSAAGEVCPGIAPDRHPYRCVRSLVPRRDSLGRSTLNWQTFPIKRWSQEGKSAQAEQGAERKAEEPQIRK